MPFRKSIKRLLHKMPGLYVVAEAENSPALARLVVELKPDLLIIDIDAVELGGRETITLIKKQHPGLGIISVSMTGDPHQVHAFMEAGVDGYLLKQDADIEFLAAITFIRQGQPYLSSLIDTG